MQIIQCSKPRAEATAHEKPAPGKGHHFSIIVLILVYYCCLSACLPLLSDGKVCKGGNSFVYSFGEGNGHLGVRSKLVSTGKHSKKETK